MKKLLMIVLCVLPICLIAQTQIDTIYSTPELDGTIFLVESLNTKKAITNGTYITVGDGHAFSYGGVFLGRAYLSFDLNSFSHNIEISETILGVYQWQIVGNSTVGTYPVWDIPGADTLLCHVDHISYGDTLDTLDWSAGDFEDAQTLHPKLGIITDDTVLQYKTMAVTDFVIDDLKSGRNKSQYRLAFDIQNSDDKKADNISFGSGDSPESEKPYLIIKYDLINGVEENQDVSKSNMVLCQNYPNPFNLETMISYKLPTGGTVRLELFNVSGEKVKNLVNEHQAYGSYQFRISAGDLPSGVYLCRLRLTADKGQVFFKSKKLLLIK